MSTAGLEPARVSPHAPQTCAYTDSATSTQGIFSYSIVKFVRCLCGGDVPLCFTSLSKNDTQSFFSAECHIGKVQFSFQCYYIIKLIFIFCKISLKKRDNFLSRFFIFKIEPVELPFPPPAC